LIGSLGFDWITGSSGSIFLKKKSKRHHFSKKNKNQRVATGFLIGSHRVFSSPVFFQPGPVPAPDRPDRPGFDTMSKTIENVEEEKEYGRTYPVTAMEKTVKLQDIL
jgi:hypothetical protein